MLVGYGLPFTLVRPVTYLPFRAYGCWIIPRIIRVICISLDSCNGVIHGAFCQARIEFAVNGTVAIPCVGQGIVCGIACSFLTEDLLHNTHLLRSVIDIGEIMDITLGGSD